VESSDFSRIALVLVNSLPEDIFSQFWARILFLGSTYCYFFLLSYSDSVS
jgi:hypothetical protein